MTDDPTQALYTRVLDDGWEITVYRMLYSYRVCLGEVDSAGIVDAYCYYDLTLALQAAVQWDGNGDPLDGWHKNPMTGRRRFNGDPSREEIFW